MTKKLAVVVVHGMGSQATKTPQPSDTPTFSKDLHKKLRRNIGKKQFDADIVWREVRWAHVLQKREEDYLRSVRHLIKPSMARKFVMNNLTDAAAYRKTSDDDDPVYEKIHNEVETTLKEVENLVPAGTPLLVLAHSLGGHIMSNFIYDIQSCLRNTQSDKYSTDFQNLKYMAGLVTFGCNIPIFTFSYPKSEIFAVNFPGTMVPNASANFPWWRNYYDKDDALGFPLGFTSDSYAALKSAGGLKDQAINAGGLFSSWNPLSHNGYWRDADFYEPVADFMRDLM